MATLDITEATLQDTVANNDTVMLDFWASWCAPCRQFGPVFEAASEKHPGIVFGKVNTEEQQQLAMQFDISSIPTLMVFKQGVIVFSQPGALRAADLETLIAAVEEFDVEKAMAEQSEAEAAR